MNRSIGFGVVGFVSAVAAAVVAPESISDLFLFAGLGFAYIGVVGYIGIWQATGVRLLDEREQEIERRTGYIITLVVLTVTIFGLPAAIILNATGTINAPPVLRGVIWGYSALTFLGLFIYGYVERQYS